MLQWQTKLFENEIPVGTNKNPTPYEMGRVWLHLKHLSSKGMFFFQICVYCKGKGASIGCFHKKCRYVFHFPCGLENGALNQHFGAYRYVEIVRWILLYNPWNTLFASCMALKGTFPPFSSCLQNQNLDHFSRDIVRNTRKGQAWGSGVVGMGCLFHRGVC